VDELVVLDAVGVAARAQESRDRADATEPPARTVLREHAVELDDIAEAAVLLDQHEHEIEHQLRWWQERADTLEAALTGNAADDVDTVRELALYRGRISGALTMRRHYAEQRSALVARLARADADCAARLATS
jgi:hypothetical protein